MKSILIASLEIAPHPGRFDEPPCVTLHQRGASTNVWLTPSEARAVAAELVKAADTAEAGR